MDTRPWNGKDVSCGIEVGWPLASEGVDQSFHGAPMIAFAPPASRTRRAEGPSPPGRGGADARGGVHLQDGSDP